MEKYLNRTEVACRREMVRRARVSRRNYDAVEVFACAIALITLGAFSIVCAFIAF